MNLFNTTAFSMAVRFAVLFVIISVAALASIYFFTMQAIGEQTDREIIHELGELEAQYYQEGRQSLLELIERRDQYGKHLHHFYAVTDEKVVFTAGSIELYRKVPNLGKSIEKISFSTSNTTIHGYEADDILRIASVLLDDGSYVIVGQEQQSLVELRSNTLTAMTIAVALICMLSLFGGYYMGRYALRNIGRIDEGLAVSIKNDFSSLLPLPKEHDEFYALTEKLNLMLSRIHDLISSIRQVTGNVAHELRSPLTRMRNRLEVTLLQSRSTDEYRNSMEQAIEDCNDLLKTFNALLNIARAESGVRSEDWGELVLPDLLEELAELYSAVAEEAGHDFIWRRPQQDFKVEGNRQLLAQTFSNVLDNAIKYTPVGGTITLTLSESSDGVVVSICDNGKGIPDDSKGRVLERFQRLDDDGYIAGSGLGLSLVQAVAKLHGAKLRLEDNHPGLCVNLLFRRAGVA